MEQIQKLSKKINLKRSSQLLIRFFSSLSIFAITVFFTPNFQISSFPILILSSLTVMILDYFMSVIIGIHDLPLGRGLVGFSSFCIIIYITQYFVSGYYISIFSSVIAGAIYGIMDSMIPNHV